MANDYFNRTIIVDVFALLFVFLFPLVSTALASDMEVKLKIGETQRIQFQSPATTVEIHRSGIIRIKDDADRSVLIVHALAQGQTNIRAVLQSGDQKDISVTVQAGSQETAISSNTDSSTVQSINRVLAQQDMSNMRARSIGRILVLEGSPKNMAQASMALRLARQIAPQIEDHLDRDVQGGPSVAIEVMFVEVTRENQKDIGFSNSTSDKTVGSLAGATLNQRTGTKSSGPWNLNWQVGALSSFLNLIESRSYSRVLANPKLVTRSGVQASFQAGENLYIQSFEESDTKLHAKLEEVTAGILLTITPRMDAIGQIDTTIDTQVSEFGEARKGVAATKSISKVQTAVTVLDGESILLSGLIRKRNIKNVDRVPLLADIPLVGELFKNRKSNQRETEMMITVSMNRVRPVERRHLDAANELWKRGGSDVEFKFFD